MFYTALGPRASSVKPRSPREVNFSLDAAIACGYGDAHDSFILGHRFDVRRCALFVLMLLLRRDLYSNGLITVSDGLFDGLTKLEFL